MDAPTASSQKLEELSESLILLLLAMVVFNFPNQIISCKDFCRDSRGWNN
jgi:hypothetical protein